MSLSETLEKKDAIIQRVTDFLDGTEKNDAIELLVGWMEIDRAVEMVEFWEGKKPVKPPLEWERDGPNDT